MSLGSSLFILFVFVLLVIIFLPIRIHIQAEHHERWHGTVQLQILWFRIPLKNLRNKVTRRMNKRTEHMMQRMESGHQKESRNIQLYWKPILSFGRQALHIAAERIHVEQLNIQCSIGWSRADYTAYSYGLFWAVLSALPEHWRQKSTFVYKPNFQQNRQEIFMQSIIYVRAAQIIGILIALFVLTVRMMLAQNRKEQVGYET